MVQPDGKIQVKINNQYNEYNGKIREIIRWNLWELPYKHTTYIPRWNSMETTASTSF